MIREIAAIAALAASTLAERGPRAQATSTPSGYTDDALCADVWLCTELSLRDYSPVTQSALDAIGPTADLHRHLARDLNESVRLPKIASIVTRPVLDLKRPEARAAAAITGEGGKKDATTMSDIQIVPKGRSPSSAPASHFTGSVTIASPFKGTGAARLGGATVTFEPGARTNWHTHPLGQLLIVTKGRGWVQSEGQPVREFGPGDTVWIAPGLKHWHGATRAGAMTHVAVAEALDGQSVTWLQAVSDSAYHGPK